MTQFYRYTLVAGDPDRNFTVFWSRDRLNRDGDQGFAVTSPTATLLPLRLRETEQFESWHWQAFRCDTVGTHEVYVNGRLMGSVTVVAGTPSKTYTRLGEIVGPYTLPPGVRFRGYGCTLTGDLVVSPGCTVTGLTVDGNVTGSFDNCVFDSCTFRRGMVGPMLPADRQTLFRDCEFRNATAATLSSGLLHRCRWLGKPALGGHNFCNERATRLAMIDCTFEETDRGIIARSTWGDNSDNLYAGIWFKNIAMTPNGGELICVEGNRFPSGFNRNLVFCLRQSACVGSILFFDGSASDNLLSNVRLPVDICGLAPQRGNIIRDSECDYIRINWNGNKGATGTVIQDVACIGFKPSASGLASGDPKYYRPGTFVAVVDDASPIPTTQCIRVTVKGQDSLFAPFRGIQN